MNRIRGAALLGLTAGLALRPLLRRILMVRLRGDIERINDGDYRPFLRAYADDAVLHFNDGAHRWAGDHRGKAAIERFLQDFVAAGLKVDLKDLWVSGPPWRMVVIGRLDDEARGPGGELLYSNRVVLVLQSRWGKIVRHDDFYEDTSRMAAFDAALRELGIDPVGEGTHVTRPLSV
ncbi:MAG TPA: nuclear transport factor 2 family protein [Solirubrobacteraceae bacterium]|nr:nuclear transport factor 2 family protein [Solirubrobacteraceae bacterium]